MIGGAILLWIAGRATPGDVTYVLTSYYIIHAYLRDVGMHINNLQRSVNDMEELVAIHGEPIGIADAADAVPIDIQGGRIVFDGVTFHYGGHPAPLYDGLSVDIRAGERVGLVGRSGSGKTTFVKLVQRLYDVSGGRILIDGQDIAKATQHSLRSQIAIVQQDPILFHRTLAENIAYGRPGASMAAIEQAARLANAHDFILRLPKGYGTLVGERGVKLSGGERQRVALARAFLADAPVLILDEATSSLEFGIGRPDPAGDGAADEGPHLDRDRAPAVDGAQPRPHPGVRSRQDRRAGHPCHADRACRAASIAACSSGRRPSSAASRRRGECGAWLADVRTATRRMGLGNERPDARLHREPHPEHGAADRRRHDHHHDLPAGRSVFRRGTRRSRRRGRGCGGQRRIPHQRIHAGAGRRHGRADVRMPWDARIAPTPTWSSTSRSCLSALCGC